MLKNKSKKLIAILLSVLLSGLIPAAVTLADTLLGDADGRLVVNNGGNVQYGSYNDTFTSSVKLSPGEIKSFPLSLGILKEGSSTDHVAFPVTGTAAVTTSPNVATLLPTSWTLTDYTLNTNGTFNLTVTAPNSPGWYTYVVTFTADSDLDKLTSSTATATLNVEVVAPTPSDTLPPRASHALSTTVWTNGNVGITVTAQDSGSGLKSITGPSGTVVAGSTATLDATANGSFTFKLEDHAGNKADYVVVVDNIDKVNPTAGHTLTPSTWTKGNVEIAVTAQDLGSGLKSITGPAGTVVDGATATLSAAANGSFTFTLEDNAGNTFDYVVKVDIIDLLAPTADHTLTPSTWTQGNVEITVNAQDAASGMKSITLPSGTVVAGDTATFTATTNESFTFILEDNVGNTFDYAVVVGNIDREAPTATHTFTPSTWTNGNVVITVTAQDLGSGLESISGPSGTIYDGSTATFTATTNGSFTFTLEDKAGNTSDYVAEVENIDRVAPTAIPSLTPSAWTNGNVEIIVTGDDDASGLKSITGPLGTVVVDGTATFTATTNGSYTFTLEDKAGNTFDCVVIVENIDRVNPTATHTIDPESWTNGDVKIVVTGDDEASGVKSISLLEAGNVETPLPLLDGDTSKIKKAEYTVTENSTYTFLVRDQAGNSIEHGVVVTNIDKTKPEITITTPVEGASYQLNEVILADWSATDSLSGIASSVGTVAKGVAIDTASIGTKTFTVTATDHAGNTETRTATYKVIYDFDGFFQPIDMGGVINIAKAGSSIPIKFSLNGYMGMDILIGVPKAYTYNVNSNEVTSEVETIMTAGKSNLSYDPATDQYTYVWKTDKVWAGSGKQLAVTLSDGTIHYAYFKFK